MAMQGKFSWKQWGGSFGFIYKVSAKDVADSSSSIRLRQQLESDWHTSCCRFCIHDFEEANFQGCTTSVYTGGLITSCRRLSMV